jgi:hypothetical protein
LDCASYFVNNNRVAVAVRLRESCSVKAGELVHLGFMEKETLNLGKDDSLVRTNSEFVSDASSCFVEIPPFTPNHD